jgi:hypothetical protein
MRGTKTMGSGMMSGATTFMGLAAGLGLLVLVLAAAALIKYLFTKR